MIGGGGRLPAGAGASGPHRVGAPGLRRAVAMVLAVLLALALPTARAAAWDSVAEPSFTRLSMARGLSQLVSGLAQDRDGFLWFATVGGLARWDGYRMRSFRHDPADPDSLPDNYLLSILVDQAGRIWLGSNGAGLARFDPATERFVPIPLETGGAQAPAVLTLRDAVGGGLWIGTDRGLFHLAEGAASGRPVALEAGSGRIQAILQEADGTLWIGTPSGLVRRGPEAERFAPVPVAPGWTVPPDVRGLMQDSGGTVWAGTRASGVGRVETVGGQASVLMPVAVPGLPSSAWVEALAETPDGALWIGSNAQGLIRMTPGDGVARQFLNDAADPWSPGDDTAWDFLLDRSGTLWVATNQGVSRLFPQGGAILSLRDGSRADAGPGSLRHQDIRAVSAAPGGRLWVGYLGAGVDLFDPVAGRVKSFRPDPAATDEAGLPEASIYALAATPDGGTFVGTTRGLYRIDAGADTAGPVRFADGRRDLLILSLARQGEALWIGTANEGLFRLDLSSGRLDQAAAPGDGPGRLASPTVTALEPDGADGLWVGTRAGVYRLEPGRGIVAHLTGADNAATGSTGILGNSHVNDLLLDGQGRLWVANGATGIDVVAGTPGTGMTRVAAIGAAAGLPNERPNALVADRNGRIWVSSDDGLAVIDPDRFAVRSLLRENGYLARSAWIGAATALPGGTLAFGGVGALTLARPDRLSGAAAGTGMPGGVVVTEIRIGGKRVPDAPFNRADAGPLVLPPGSGALEVEFAIPDAPAPDRVRYAFLLDGIDPDWVGTDASRRVAAYTRLPPGDHWLTLRAAGPDGGTQAAERRLLLRVLPAWHETGWFRGLLLLAGLAGVGLVVRLRTAVLRRREQALERQVAERTRELAESHAQLERIAYLDVLTGLPNRRMFTRDLAQAISRSRRCGVPFALVLTDVDRFKQINDTLGHDAGDALLGGIAETLRRCVRETDQLARLGGDEFSILLADGDPAGVDVVCRRLLEAFAEPVSYKEHRLQTGLSLGVALYPTHASTPEGLYKAADLALYEAKRAGRGTWRWYAADAVDDGGVSAVVRPG